MSRAWRERLIPTADEERAWELYHENSKLTRYDAFPSAETVLDTMAKLFESLPLPNHPIVELPSVRPSLSMPLGEAVERRESGRILGRDSISLPQLAVLLHAAYGVTRVNAGAPRAFRTVPSGGALYPLELYVHAANVTGLTKGLYHFDARAERLRAMNDGDLTAKIASALVQPEIALHAAAIVFITALFERSSFKYSERAYRFALIEAGHVGQNLDLAAVGLGLTALNVGGYYDHEVDELLGLDGVDHSTIYLTAIGRNDAP